MLAWTTTSWKMQRVSERRLEWLDVQNHSHCLVIWERFGFWNVNFKESYATGECESWWITFRCYYDATPTSAIKDYSHTLMHEKCASHFTDELTRKFLLFSKMRRNYSTLKKIKKKMGVLNYLKKADVLNLMMFLKCVNSVKSWTTSKMKKKKKCSLKIILINYYYIYTYTPLCDKFNDWLNRLLTITNYGSVRKSIFTKKLNTVNIWNYLVCVDEELLRETSNGSKNFYRSALLQLHTFYFYVEDLQHPSNNWTKF